MQRFVKLLIIFFLPILLVALCTEILLRKIPNDYTYKRNFLSRHSDAIKVLVMGSSHAYYDIDPSYLSLPAFNASHIAQSLDYDARIIKKYDSHWSQLKYIIIPLDYYSLYNRMENAGPDPLIKNYSIYYGFDISSTLSQHTELFSTGFSINSKRILDYYFYHHGAIFCSPLGWGTGYRSGNSQYLIKSGAERAKTHSGTEKINIEQNMSVLISIITYAMKINATVILLTPPVYITYTDHLDKDLLNRVVSTGMQLSNHYENTFYYNFMEDSLFTKTDFFDADHLNHTGAVKFSKKINELLQNISSCQIRN